MKFKEIEFKYDAKEIPLKLFTQIMETYGSKIDKRLIVSSYDDYFINETGNFIRYRHNNNDQELTIKRKMIQENNNERIEVNMTIVPQDFSTIEEFIKLLGYTHDFRIYKVCNIYWIDKVVISYYLVFDENMMELNRFIEIEANEDLKFRDEIEALNIISYYEKKLNEAGLPLIPEKRLKKSLFEMYSKFY
jgi:adenylate cyclase class IV